MNELDAILDECLRRMSAEGKSVEQCLASYPEVADQLRPLLEAARRFESVAAISPAYGYRATARAKLMVRAEDRRHTPLMLRPAWQLTVALTAFIIVALFSTTAFAQTALPGQALYDWKLSSEHVWRAVSSDPVGVDLSIAERRTMELTKVANDPELVGQARDEFHEVLSRLEAEKDTGNGPKIDQAFLAHQKQLSQAGIKDEKLDDLVQHGKKH